MSRPFPAAARNRSEPASPIGRQGWLAAASIVGALAASSCCILPLVLFSLGATGAWIGNLTALTPYQPAILAVTVGFLAAGFVLAYRKPGSRDCADTRACGRRASRHAVKGALWLSVVLAAMAFAFPYVAPALLDV